MLNPLISIRERYHPLFRLRKVGAFQWMTRYFDVPVRVWFDPVSHPVYVSFSKNLSWVLSRGKVGEELEREHFVFLLKTGVFTRFFDVGANIGLYGFIFHSVVRQGTVTMIEPDPANGNLIQRTIFRAKVQNVELIRAAAADHEGTALFHTDDLSGATGSILAGESSFVARYHKVEPSAVTVTCITLDAIAAKSGEDPDFLKIDVEGVELKVLCGAEKMISRSHPAIFIECDVDKRAVESFLRERGYLFFDFSSMQSVDAVPHNCLALHMVNHAAIIQKINWGRFQSSGETLVSK
jgi:FkbM family methyltransferase